MQNDKDGGWSIMKRIDRTALYNAALDSTNYIRCAGVSEEAFALARSLGKRISVLEEDFGWSRAVGKAARSSTVVAKLRLLLKSHKDASKVTCRAIHSLPCFSFEAHSRWLMAQIRERLRGVNHLMRSSAEVVKRLHHVSVPGKLFLVKLDIKDFYVVGEAHIIAEKVARLFECEKRRSLIFDITYFLLSNQFVKSGGALYEVARGTGIGLLHSGDVADACFYSMVEKPLENSFVAAGVLDWYRFRDDMLFLASDAAKFNALKAKMEALSDFFVLEVENVSCVSVRYLDIVVQREDCRVVALPFLKDPNLSRKLPVSSAHPWSVHKSWPSVLVKRTMSLASKDVIVKPFLEEVSARLRNDGCFVPSFAESSSKMLARKPSARALWLPLGYHPWWCKTAKKAVARINKDASFQSLLSMTSPGLAKARIRIAWRNMLPCNQTLFQR